ncbi:MAG: hypothetical protein EBX65_01345, partial [Betaproteobacteria bacterium]|nr:hypothetical protein [Betaproteobacteria bacterium]
MHKDLGIALIGTGGTIAGRASDATTASHYRPASLGVDAILASIPELATRYRIEVQQAFQLGLVTVKDSLHLLGCLWWHFRFRLLNFNFDFWLF